MKVSYQMTAPQTLEWKTYTSKVYDSFLMWFPSGRQRVFKVWNTDLNKMIVVKVNNTTIID